MQTTWPRVALLVPLHVFDLVRRATRLRLNLRKTSLVYFGRQRGHCYRACREGGGAAELTSGFRSGRRRGPSSGLRRLWNCGRLRGTSRVCTVTKIGDRARGYRVFGQIILGYLLQLRRPDAALLRADRAGLAVVLSAPMHAMSLGLMPHVPSLGGRIRVPEVSTIGLVDTAQQLVEAAPILAEPARTWPRPKSADVPRGSGLFGVASGGSAVRGRSEVVFGIDLCSRFPRLGVGSGLLRGRSRGDAGSAQAQARMDTGCFAPMWGRPGFDSGSSSGTMWRSMQGVRFGVGDELGPMWGRSAVDLGSTWGQAGSPSGLQARST